MRSAKNRLGFLALLGAVTVATGCSEELEEDTHDFVKVQLTQSIAATESPFAGTTNVELTAEYDECFTSFYISNPNYVLDGVDGALIFGGEDLGGEGWKDRLCDSDEPSQAECTIETFTQVLEMGVPPTLTVRYAVTGDVRDRLLLLGPLPTSDFADCDGGISPRVTLQGARGLGGNNMPVWQMENGGLVATPGQGAPMVVKARAG